MTTEKPSWREVMEREERYAREVGHGVVSWIDRSEPDAARNWGTLGAHHARIAQAIRDAHIAGIRRAARVFDEHSSIYHGEPAERLADCIERGEEEI